MKTSAQDILKAKLPGDLFTNNADALKLEYFELSKRWHPDMNGNSLESKEVMIKINDLYQKALVLIKDGKWEMSNWVTIVRHGNVKQQFKFLTSMPFELGMQYISDSNIAYLVNGTYKTFYDNYLKSISSLKYTNDDMKKEFTRFLPKMQESFETYDKQYCIFVEKMPDLLLLKDVLGYYKGILPDRHVAWIMSSLYNLACFIDFNNLSHNGISLSNYYISPKYHSGALLGGWWYATAQDSNMIGISSETYNLLPSTMRENHVGSITTDLESIRYLGRQLLGEANGSKIKNNTSLPKSMIDWFLAGSSDSAYEEYARWNVVLTNSYGKRQFIEMDLSADKIYQGD